MSVRFLIMIIFGYIWHFFFYGATDIESPRGFCRYSAATLFQRFRGFPALGFQWKQSSLRKFFFASPSAPAPFLQKNSWFLALKFLHSFSVHGAAKGSGAFQYLRSILCQLSRLLFLSMCHSRFPKLDINGDL